MHKLLTKIIRLLDGTPAVYGKRQSGQSVVELALITPILIILLAGLVEIGWFANNYLTLLDVTRAGARRGAVLQDQKSPLFWDDSYSYVPQSLLADSDFWMPCTADELAAIAPSTDCSNRRFEYRWYPTVPSAPVGSQGQEPCDTSYTPRLFYNEVLCTMIVSMEPLSLNPENGIDDIVVSGFGLQMVDPSTTSDPTWWLDPTTRPVPANVAQTVVAARYPANANECQVLDDGSGNPVAIGNAREGRDPFDFNNNNETAHSGRGDIQPPSGVVSINGVDDFTEVPGYDGPPSFNASLAEKQVGFPLFGNHRIEGTFCVGSDWTMHDVEELMNLPQYDLLNTDPLNANAILQKTNCLPSQGLILVELHWEHEMLLKIPLLSPVFTAVGNSEGKMVINVWAAFPLSAAEPHILFPTPTGYAPKGGCDV